MLEALRQTADQRLVEILKSNSPLTALACRDINTNSLKEALRVAVADLCLADPPQYPQLRRILTLFNGETSSASKLNGFILEEISGQVNAQLEGVCSARRLRDKVIGCRRASELVGQCLPTVSAELKEMAFLALSNIANKHPQQAIEMIKTFQLFGAQITALACHFIRSQNWKGFKHIKKEFASVLRDNKAQMEMAAFVAITRAESSREISIIQSHCRLPAKEFRSSLLLCVQSSLRSGDIEGAIKVSKKYRIRFDQEDPLNNDSIADCCLGLAKAGRWEDLFRLRDEWQIEFSDQIWGSQLRGIVESSLGVLLIQLDFEKAGIVISGFDISDQQLGIFFKDATLELVKMGKFTGAEKLVKHFNLDSELFQDEESQVVFRQALSQVGQVFPFHTFRVNEDVGVDQLSDDLSRKKLQHLANEIIDLPYRVRRELVGLINRISGKTDEDRSLVVDHWLKSKMRGEGGGNNAEVQDILLSLRSRMIENRWSSAELALINILGLESNLSVGVGKRENLTSILLRTKTFHQCAQLGVVLHQMPDAVEFMAKVERRVKAGGFGENSRELDHQVEQYRSLLFSRCNSDEIADCLRCSRLPDNLLEEVDKLLSLRDEERRQETGWKRGYFYQGVYHRLNTFYHNAKNLSLSWQEQERAYTGPGDYHIQSLLFNFSLVLRSELRVGVEPRYWYQDFPLGYALTDELFAKYRELYEITADPDCVVDQELIDDIEVFRMRCLGFFARQRVSPTVINEVENAVKRSCTYLLDSIGEDSIYRRADMEVINKDFARRRADRLFERAAKRLLREHRTILDSARSAGGNAWKKALFDFENKWGFWIGDKLQNGLDSVPAKHAPGKRSPSKEMPNQFQLFLEEKYFEQVRSLNGMITKQKLER